MQHEKCFLAWIGAFSEIGAFSQGYSDKYRCIFFLEVTQLEKYLKYLECIF